MLLFFTSDFSGVDSGSWRLDPPLVACFLTGGSSGVVSSEVVSSGLDRLDPPLAVAFWALGALGEASGLERLDPPRFVSFSTSGSSGEESRLACLDLPLVGSSSDSDSGSGLDSLYTGFLVVRWLSLFTAGFLGFLEGAPFLTGVAVDSFLAADCFLPPFFTAALTGDL